MSTPSMPFPCLPGRVATSWEAKARPYLLNCARLRALNAHLVNFPIRIEEGDVNGGLRIRLDVEFDDPVQVASAHAEMPIGRAGQC